MRISKNRRLGDILLASGLITETQLMKAVNRQMEHGGKIGEALVALN